MSGSVTDVGARAEVDALFDDVRAKVGDLTVLVNVVGMAGPRAAIEDIDEDEWDKTIAVNLSGMFYTMKRAVPMLKAERRRIDRQFFDLFDAHRHPVPRALYRVEGGGRGLTKNSARELGPAGIRVNAILPGIINNDRFRFIVQRNVDATGRSFEDIENDYLKYVSLRCKVELGEFADMVEFITSDAGKKITGEISPSAAIWNGKNDDEQEDDPDLRGHRRRPYNKKHPSMPVTPKQIADACIEAAVGRGKHRPHPRPRPRNGRGQPRPRTFPGSRRPRPPDGYRHRAEPDVWHGRLFPARSRA